jgi:hypothetical protein
MHFASKYRSSNKGGVLVINRGEITYDSKSGIQTHNMLLTHNTTSKNLAILFPGGDNSTDIPTLHYARKAALLAGCDILSLQYGYYSLNNSEIVNKVVEECYEIIQRAFTQGYLKIFLICKSVGHFIALRTGDMLIDKEINFVCYTPLSNNIESIKKLNALVITGTNDKWCCTNDSDALIALPNIELLRVKNAAHSLEIDDDYERSIEILQEITDRCSCYIRKNMLT